MDTPAATPDAPPAVEATRWVAVGCVAALIALGVAWEMWLAPLRPGGTWLWIKVLPLVAPLPGLYRRRLYTYRWVSLLVWLYVIEGAVRAWSDRGLGAKLALAEIALCILLFAACALHVRLRLRKANA
jgi:uncharacterized membrane protein